MNTLKGIAFAFVVALVLSVAVQAQPIVCTQNGAVDSRPACFEPSLKIGGGSGLAVWSEAGTLQFQKDPDARYNIGSTTAKHTDKTLANVWHEKWEFHDGKLHVLKPMEVLYLGQPVQLGRPAPDEYGVGSLERMRAVVAEGVAQAAPFICGRNDRNPAPNIDLIQVSCIDWDAMRRVAPDYPWPAGKQTQVLVHVRDGDTVRVTVGNVSKFADLLRDAWGRLVALVPFDGVGHESVEVRVYRAVD